MSSDHDTQEEPAHVLQIKRLLLPLMRRPVPKDWWLSPGRREPERKLVRSVPASVIRSFCYELHRAKIPPFIPYLTLDHLMAVAIPLINADVKPGQEPVISENGVEGALEHCAKMGHFQVGNLFQEHSKGTTNTKYEPARTSLKELNGTYEMPELEDLRSICTMGVYFTLKGFGACESSLYPSLPELIAFLRARK